MNDEILAMKGGGHRAFGAGPAAGIKNEVDPMSTAFKGT